jgi:N6-L-threonylcarbamoyladenine synthase
VFDVLINKLIKAGKKKDVSSLVLAGGVACNRTLRHKLTVKAGEEGMKVFYPRSEFCTDNGAMIALAGYFRALDHEYADMSIDVRSRYPVKDIKSINK